MGLFSRIFGKKKKECKCGCCEHTEEVKVEETPVVEEKVVEEPVVEEAPVKKAPA